MLDIAGTKITNKKIKNSRVLHADFTEKTPNFKVDIILMSLSPSYPRYPKNIKRINQHFK